MLRRIFRLLPHSSQASSKILPVFRQRTIVAPVPRPSSLLFICLGVSVATFATITTIHADSASAPDDPTVQISKISIRNFLPQNFPPTPTADETFELFSGSGTPSDKAVGITRIDTILLASNQPCEDVIQHKLVKFYNTVNLSLFGLYDGHNGDIMSEFLGETLISEVLGQLFELYSKHVTPSNPEHIEVGGRFSFEVEDIPNGDQLQLRGESIHPSDKEIDQCIKDTFTSLDSLVVDKFTKLVLDRQFSKEEGVRLLSLPIAGSCALLGIYNNIKRTFKVAVTGDSRAVLGRRVALKDDTYAYETHVLSADQNGHNPREVERLEAAHPGEKIFENGRVLGWGISRAFGDAVCKWSLEIQQRVHEEYLGDRIRSNCLTPPYFTAEPEITTTTIRKGDFVVLASDGLWDSLTNEEVVGLVGGWLETRGEEVIIGKGDGIGEGEMVMIPTRRLGHSGEDHRKGFGKGRGNGWAEGSNGDSDNKIAKDEDETTIWERTDLPVTSMKPDETVMYSWWQATKRFVNIDGNSAVHLARNALGGADRDLTGALLQLRPPRSRRYRDDISVQIIFFD